MTSVSSGVEDREGLGGAVFGAGQSRLAASFYAAALRLKLEPA